MRRSPCGRSQTHFSFQRTPFSSRVRGSFTLPICSVGRPKRSRTAAWSMPFASAVTLAADHVDHVEGGGPTPDLVGLAGAVGDDVEAELAVGRLERGVGFARGDLDPLGDSLEL